MEEISGGSPYGASTIAGTQGERMPSLNELAMARGLARRLTNMAKRLGSWKQ